MNLVDVERYRPHGEYRARGLQLEIMNALFVKHAESV